MEDGHSANELESWRFYEIRGKYGSIWPYSRTNLACLITTNRIGERVKRNYPHWKLIQNGNNEMCFMIENDFLHEASKIISARYKRQLTEEQKNRLAEMGRSVLSGLRKST